MTKRLKRRLILLLAFSVLVTPHTMAQSCDCPNVCSECIGFVVQYTLQYQGEEPARVEVKDGADNVFDQTVNPGEWFDVKGTLPNGRFMGTRIHIYIDGKENAALDAVCSSNTRPNTSAGNFVVVEAIRTGGRKVCCPDSGQDKIAPQFGSIQEDITVFADEGKCTAKVYWERPVVKDCNLSVVEVTHEPGHEFQVGTTDVIFHAKDAAGNSTAYTFKVTVMETVPPSFISCAANMTVTATSDKGAIVKWNEPDAVDNCDVKSIVASHRPGTMFPVGTTTVTYTAIDYSGNTTTCEFEVVVSLKDEPAQLPPPPEVPDLDIVRIVTPDGDGINDRWIIRNVEHYPGTRVVIFDRWGSAIFSAQNYDNTSVAWRGLSATQSKLPAGTYFYVINYFRQGAPQERKGFIELIP